MSHVIFERDGKTIRVNEATVAEVIGLMDHQFERQRKELIEDLEAVNASEDLKLEEVKKLRDEKGLTSKLIRYAFTLRGAIDVIQYVVPEEKREECLNAEPDEIVWLALRLLGFNMSDQSEQSEEDESEDPTKDRATSTAKS
tara:strand:- start:286 stop:711 length:426 start_codon:yes stop_codon:yes gene_type:complete